MMPILRIFDGKKEEAIHLIARSTQSLKLEDGTERSVLFQLMSEQAIPTSPVTQVEITYEHLTEADANNLMLLFAQNYGSRLAAVCRHYIANLTSSRLNQLQIEELLKTEPDLDGLCRPDCAFINGSTISLLKTFPIETAYDSFMFRRNQLTERMQLELMRTAGAILHKVIHKEDDCCALVSIDPHSFILSSGRGKKSKIHPGDSVEVCASVLIGGIIDVAIFKREPPFEESPPILTAYARLNTACA